MESKHTKGELLAIGYAILLANVPDGHPNPIIATTNPVLLNTINTDSDVISREEAEANATHFCKCVNAHEELIVELKGMVEYWEREIGSKIKVLHQLPVNEYYRTSKKILEKLAK